MTLHEPDWHIDEAELRAAFGPRTRGIVLTSPHNPTGKVFSRAELELIAELCVSHDAVAFTDEIYEHLVFEGQHIPLATLPGMAERTVAINSLSKTYSVTGWRVGWVIAAPELTAAIRKVHDFLTVGAAAPLQAAGTVALGLPEPTTRSPARRVPRASRAPARGARTAGFAVYPPAGAYYVMTDAAALLAAGEDDIAFARRLVADPGVAAVPGSSFYSHPSLGRTKVRFAFPKRLETIDAAAARLAPLSGAAAEPARAQAGPP